MLSSPTHYALPACGLKLTRPSSQTINVPDVRSISGERNAYDQAGTMFW